MDLFSLALFAFALFLNAGTPGPSIIALVSRVVARGWSEMMPFIFALWVGEILWLTIAMAGLSVIAQTFHEVFVVLKYIGVAYLLYLAWKMWTTPMSDNDADLPKPQSAVSMFFAGFALTMGNPKIMVFYLTLLPSLVDLSAPSFGLWAIVATVAASVLIVVDLAWVGFAHHARSLLRTPKAIRMANRIGGAALAGAATVIATRGNA